MRKGKGQGRKESMEPIPRGVWGMRSVPLRPRVVVGCADVCRLFTTLQLYSVETYQERIIYRFSDKCNVEMKGKKKGGWCV